MLTFSKQGRGDIMEYTLSQCRKMMIDSISTTPVGVDWFAEIPRLTKTNYEFHYLRGFIEGVFEW
jgi:hypothetical protein